MLGLKKKQSAKPTEKNSGEEKALSLRQQKRNARKNAKQHAAKLKQLEKNTALQNVTTKKKTRSKAAPKTVQQYIGYERLYDDGICCVEPGLYSRTFQLSDINYQSARRDEQLDLFTRYCEALNYIDPTMHMQLSIINRRIDKEDFTTTMLMPMDESDGLDKYRQEANSVLMKKALEGQNSIIREKYVTISTPAPSYEGAIAALARRESDLAGHFKALGCEVTPQNGHQRLGVLFEHFHPDEKFSFDYGTLIYSDLTTKDHIAPKSLDFSEKSSFVFGDHYGQVLCLKQMPVTMSDQLIKDISDLPFNLTITIHLDNIDQGKALEYVRMKLAFMEQEATGKQDQAVQKGRNTEIAVPMETRRSYEEAQKLLDQLQNQGQRLFELTMLVYTYADDPETLQDQVFQIQSIARTKNVKIDTLDFRQREGLNSILPLGKNHVEIKRSVTTSAAAAFVPFTTMELYQKGGIYYGLNGMSRNMLFFNRYSLPAPNGIYLGSPGSGKSFGAKREAILTLLSDPNADVIFIDPEREYTALAKAFDGEVIHISAGSSNYINPMDITMDYADDENPLQLKAEFVLTICELLCGGKYGLSGAQRSIISRACKIAYHPYFANPKIHPIPTLRDFYEVIKAQPEPEAKSLALDLELYIDGTLSVFANQTNVDTTKRLIVYDVRDLGKQLRTFGMLVVLDQIWNRITQNRSIGRRTWIYIDELQLLFSNEYSANYFFELWSRARKWGAVPTGITQNVETLLLSDLARRMLSNSDFIVMFNQPHSDRVELAGLLNLSNKQLSYVTNSQPGSGLLFAGKSIVPFVDDFPKDTELYRMMTSKIEELTAQKEEQSYAEGGT